MNLLKRQLVPVIQQQTMIVYLALLLFILVKNALHAIFTVSKKGLQSLVNLDLNAYNSRSKIKTDMKKKKKEHWKAQFLGFNMTCRFIPKYLIFIEILSIFYRVTIAILFLLSFYK